MKNIIVLSIMLLWQLDMPVMAAQSHEKAIRLQVKSIFKPTKDTLITDQTQDQAEAAWLNGKNRFLLVKMAKDRKLTQRLTPATLRISLLKTIYYEAKRAGLEPDLVLAVIMVESRFRKYAISSAGARGYMQVMGFWGDIVGEPSSDLFNTRTNLRLGCAILRNYLDREHGNLHRALARYNGSLGRNTYPNLIYAAWN